jgi:hypothetical protein
MRTQESPGTNGDLAEESALESPPVYAWQCQDMIRPVSKNEDGTAFV